MNINRFHEILTINVKAEEKDERLTWKGLYREEASIIILIWNIHTKLGFVFFSWYIDTLNLYFSKESFQFILSKYLQAIFQQCRNGSEVPLVFLNCSQTYSVFWITHLPLWSAGMRCVLSEHKGNSPLFLSQHLKERKSIIYREHWGSRETIHLYTNQCHCSQCRWFWNAACYLALSPGPLHCMSACV